MAAPSRSRRPLADPSPQQVEGAASSAPPPDPDGGTGRIHDLLTDAVEEAARLLDADGAMVYLTDPATGRLRFAHDAGIKSARSREWIRTIELAPGVGMFGRAVAERSVVLTTDYGSDTSFRHAISADRVVDDLGIRSMVVAPMILGDEVVGALGTFSRRHDAFDAAQIALVRSLADHAASAIANTRLIEELDRSRDELDRSRSSLARRAAAEQALRELAARITALRDPAEILQEVVELASRLVGGEGAILDLLDPETGNLRWSYDDGLSRLFTAEERAKLWISVGKGATGIAVAEDRVVVAGDDLAELFPPGPENTAFYERTGFHSMIAAPITGETGPLGVIEVYAVRPHAFVDADATLIRALASQAAIAITNARLIAELAASRAALARTADAERTLRDIAARVSAMRDKEEILQAVIDAATRVLRSSGAMIDLLDAEKTMVGDWTYRTPDDTKPDGDWEDAELEPDVGVSGLAIRTRDVQWTGDYQRDQRFIHTEQRDAYVAAMNIRSVIAAPLLERGEVLGAITVVSDRPDAYDEQDAAVLEGLADHAAIALTNSNLLARVREEEARYRFLVQNAPDVIWSIDADARLTFLSDAVERLTGFRPDELLGEHFGALVHDSSRDAAEVDWTAAMSNPTQEVRGRLNLRHRDGGAVPTEFIAIASLDAGGRFAGANGSVRDMRENDRLERELRESEDRYRNLASSSPDLVFATDSEGRYTFLSDRAATMLGWDREAALGRMFTDYVAPGWEAEAEQSYATVTADPTTVHSARIDFLKGDGSPVELEINVLGKVEGGVLVGINGVARDVSERLRLERELGQSEERFRFLVQNSPDIVFSTDAEGRFTFLSDAIERVTGHRAADVIGQHFSVLVDPATGPVAGNRWAALVADPEREQQAALVLRGPDGRRVPVDVRAIGITDDGRFAGIQGASRDVSDQVRLEGELRRQAGELAAGEERAHLARELHDSVTQALFSMTLVSRSIEMLLDRDTDAARAQLGQLRELQREALAEMRALIFELRPGNLEQEGLVRALKTHAAALQGRLGLPIVVESDLAERLPLPAEEVLYRIAQEALHNVVKHASAHQVRVDVRRLGDGVRLRVVDDGKGFDPDAVPDGHLGLAGMRARADRIGASFTCMSRIGEGATVEVAMSAEVLERLAAATDVARPDANPGVSTTRDR